MESHNVDKYIYESIWCKKLFYSAYLRRILKENGYR